MPIQFIVDEVLYVFYFSKYKNINPEYYENNNLYWVFFEGQTAAAGRPVVRERTLSPLVYNNII